MRGRRLKRTFKKVTSLVILGGVVGGIMPANHLYAQTYRQEDVVIEENIKKEQVEQVKVYRNTSLDSVNPKERKKFNINFHTLEPLGIEVIEPTQLEIMVTGEGLEGEGYLAIHNVDNIKGIQRIPVGQKIKVSLENKGQLFLDVKGIRSGKGEEEPFGISIEVVLPEASYIQTPVFDVRNQKISGNVIADSQAFIEAVTDPSHSERGMLMISDNVRMYFPLSKFVPKNFDPKEVLEKHEETIRENNRLAGLDLNDPNPIHQPRRNFVLVSARNEQAGYMSAGGQMLDTHPRNTREYFEPGWGMYHEYGHLYEQGWSLIEIWNNMFAKNMAEQTIGFTWLWENDREKFEVETIRPFYEKRENQTLQPRHFDFKDGLYFFITLEEMLGEDFVGTLERYWREEEYLPYQTDYVAYAVAKLYGVNIIPYLKVYGIEIRDEKVYNTIIEESSSSVVYVPNAKGFESYRNQSVPATVKPIYEGENINLEGIANPSSVIQLTVDGKIYEGITDKQGKFKINIPEGVTLASEIEVTVTDLGKTPSISEKVEVRTPLSDNRIELQGIGNGVKLTLGFEASQQKLKVKSSGDTIHHYFQDEYFGLKLFSASGELKKSVSAIGVGNADEMAKELHGVSFEWGDYLQIQHREPGRAKLYGKIKNSPSDLSMGAAGLELATSYFYLTKEGLRYRDHRLTGPSVSLDTVDKVQEGEGFEVSMGMWGLDEKIYAQDFSVNFNEEAIEFIGTQAIGEHKAVGAELWDGKVRILIASPSALEEGDAILKLMFKAKPGSSGQKAIIQLSEVQAGSVLEGQSQVIEVEGEKCIVEINKGESVDVNQDGKLDIADLALAVYYFKANTESTNWNEAQKVDVTGDGQIDIEDLSQIANGILTILK